MKSKLKRKTLPEEKISGTVDIELLYVKDCPHFKKTRRLIHDTIKSLCLNIPLKKVEIKTGDGSSL